MASPQVDADKILKEQQGLQAELEALRPRSDWLSRELGRLLKENHLSERVRHALEQ